MTNVDHFQPSLTAQVENNVRPSNISPHSRHQFFLGRMINIEDARGHEKRKREKCLLFPSRVPLTRFTKANLTKETNRRLPRKLLKHKTYFKA